MKHQIIYMVCAFAFAFLAGPGPGPGPVNGRGGGSEVFPTARKLLTASNNGNVSTGTEDDDDGDSPNRIGFGGTCSKDRILLDQTQTKPLPSGIPTYTVYIQNACPPLSESCRISNIHLSCGYFSTARSVDPAIFRRIEPNDCLVNDGKPLNPGELLTFSYADTFAYPLKVASVTCNYS